VANLTYVVVFIQLIATWVQIPQPKYIALPSSRIGCM